MNARSAVSVAQSPHDDASFAYAAGDVIASKYQLEELLGEGGMGAVFRARNTLLDMPVAIKLIRADLNRELLSGRLLQEARAAAKLAHPAIVRVFDVGQTERGDPFIVMELLEGHSLSTLIDTEGRLTAVRAVQLLLPIADALSAAHAKGLVHRDVKPDNVFIVNDDGALQPKLVDFGIVKLAQREGYSQLTQVGAVMGSPEYMSPEQARGLDDIDLRADVWSFSIMLYEAITGVTPFENDNYNALLRMIVETEAIPLKDLNAADEELSNIVARGLSKDRSARYESLGQLGKALATWLADQGITEDACGVSLESKWLSRQTDPHAAGRVSRPSLPEWIETTSGIRNVGRRLASIPAMPAPTSAETPAPSPTSAAPTLPNRKAWLLGAAAGVSLSALGSLLLLPGRQPAPEAASTIRPAPDAQVTRQTPTLAPAPTVVAPPPNAAKASTALAPTPAEQSAVERSAAERSAAEHARSSQPRRSERTTKAPQPQSVSAAPSAAPAAAAAPQSDLIAPY